MRNWPFVGKVVRQIGRLALVLFVLALCLPAGRAAVVIGSGDGDEAERLAAALSAIQARSLGHYGMTPVYGRDIEDGEYEVAVASDSPYFRVVRAVLRVEGDAMSAVIEIGSESYLYVYPGDMAAAEAADRDDWIPGEATEAGTAFTVPVGALDRPFACAAYSKNRQRWYDRQLLIDAASLPEGALAFPLPDYALSEKALLAYETDAPASEPEAEPEPEAPQPAAVGLPDGEYSVEVNLAGGSGRASVSSPTLLIVREGRAWARLLWSSPYYDYMLIGDTRYDNLTGDGGNSTFEIPVTALDGPMAVTADTTAMGDPVEIGYTLTFYRESIADKGRIPQEAAKKVLAISAAIIAVGAVLNHFVKRRRR